MGKDNRTREGSGSFLQTLRGISARSIIHFIENGYARLKALVEKSRHTYYRMVVMEADSFQEVGSYKLSLMSFYVLVSSVLVALTLVVTCIIIFTPIKRYIPGYGGNGGDRQVWELTDQVESLERKLQAQQVYTDNFRKLLVGDVQTTDQVPAETIKIPDSLLNVNASQEDAELRAAVANGKVTSGAADAGTQEVGMKKIEESTRDGKLEQMFLLAPVKGQVSMGFAPNKKHLGVDIVAPRNTVVMATADGFVISSDWTLETGNTIGVQHANNVVSFYKHNAVLLKKAGDRVKAGEAIAIIGNTGEQSSGPHLHFELWKNGRAVNPQEYIGF